VGDEDILGCNVRSIESGSRGLLGVRLFCQDRYRHEWCRRSSPTSARGLNQVFAAKIQIVIANDDCHCYGGVMRRQSQFEFRTWGGKRRGAGRKRVAERRQVAHRPRERVNAQHPILVTTRVLPDVARLRTAVMFAAIQAALEGATKWMYEPEPVRIVHASVQANHLHLVVEAASNGALSRAMKGFLVSCAKRLNKIAGRKGRVFADRFHAQAMATPTQVRNGLRYALCNARKHDALSARVRLDPYSSAFALPDWMTGDSIELADVTMQVALPRTWLLREGWRLAGTISPWETPSA
jgi:REP element-mobilizing transposase RayT